MLNVSELYLSILNTDYWIESRLLVEASDGTTKIVSENELYSINIEEKLLDKSFSIGNAVAAQIEITMVDPIDWSLPKMAKLQPQFRLVNSTQQSEWYPKGIFYVDTRERTKPSSGKSKLTLHGYDAMLMTEQDFPTVTWNTATDTQVLADICDYLDWTLESGTAEFFSTTRAGYVLPIPFKYSIREVLQSIAAVNCGTFVMDEYGQLRLVRFNALPTETYYLIDQNENKITIGGDRIVLQ